MLGTLSILKKKALRIYLGVRHPLGIRNDLGGQNGTVDDRNQSLTEYHFGHI